MREKWNFLNSLNIRGRRIKSIIMQLIEIYFNTMKNKKSKNQKIGL